MKAKNSIGELTSLPRTLSGLLVAIILLLSPGLLSAQWSAIGPNGGGAHLIAINDVDNEQSGTILAGTRNALLYQSSDQAHSWQAISFERSLTSTLNAMVAGRCRPDSFYLGTTDSELSRAGIYRLERDGKAWKVSAVMLGEPVMSLAISASDCRVMAAGTLSGVQVSRDAGKSWQRVSPQGEMDSQPIVSLAFSPESTETLYAGTPKLPWKTTDGGRTWEPIHVGILDDSDIFSIAVDKGRILIGACSGIYRSEDGGTRWQKVLGIPGESRRTYVVRMDPVHPQTIYAGTSNGFWKSVNAGSTWVQETTFPVRSIALDPQDSQSIVLATEIGIWKSGDGGATVVPANAGFVNRTVGAFLDSGNTILASAVYEVGAGTLFTTQDGGRDWTARSGDSIFGEHIFHFARVPGSIFAAGPEHVFQSRDEGQTWNPVPLTTGGAVTDLIGVPGSGAVLVATTIGLYETRDLGAKWLRVPMPGGVSRIEKLRTSTSGTIWGILSDGNVYLSSNKGATWKSIVIPAESGPAYDFVLRANSEILVGTLRGLIFSDTSGVGWSLPSQGMHPGTVTSVLWHPTERQLMFSVQNGIPWKSLDSGASWEPMDPAEFGGEEISELFWASDYTKLYAIGFARGVFVQQVNAPIVIAQQSAVLP